MKKFRGVIITTHPTRDNTIFTKNALESLVRQINNLEKKFPLNIQHDQNQQIGFTVPGSARLIELDDGEFAVEAEQMIYENNQERIQHSISIEQEDEEVYLKELKLKCIKRTDTNCPTYWLNHETFSVLKISSPFNKDGLLEVNDPKNILQKGIKINESLIAVYPQFMRRFFSQPNAFNKRLIDKIREIKIRCPDLLISFSVLPNAVSKISEFKEYCELDYAWGPKLPRDLSKLQLGVTKHIANEDDCEWLKITETDFWWHKENDLLALEIEELKDKSFCFLRNSLKYFPMKYAHLQYDTGNNKVVHLDCAVRVYTEEGFDMRIGKNDISKAGKKSDRIKLFRMDGALNLKDAFDVLCLFFYHNSDVISYLDQNG